MKTLMGVICAISIFLSGCATNQGALLQELQFHQVRSMSFWSGFIEKDIKNRIIPAPETVIDFLQKDYQFNGESSDPKSAVVSPSFHSDIVEAIQDLPEEVQNHLNTHLIGIFLAQNLTSTAYAEILRDNHKLGFLVLDIDALNRVANDWTTWREQSPFSDRSIYQITAILESEKDNTRKQAIQYILLHELGHFVGVATGAHPNWYKGGDAQKFSFSKISWHAVGPKYVSTSANNSPLLSKIKYYSFQESSLSSQNIREVYDQYVQTDFVSLYGGTNIFDDFAEAYAMYVHVVLQQKPWKLTIKQGDDVIREIEAPILALRCQKKKAYLDTLFKQDKI